MLRGLYSATSGMMAQQVATDNLADNLANVSTTGFKRRSTLYDSFPDMMLQRIGKGQAEATDVGKYSPGVQVRATRVDFSQGSLRQTGNPLDVALQGQGFFMVELPTGQTGYSRNGSFTRSTEGYLTTHEGAFVLNDSGGRISLPDTMDTLQIGKNGELSVTGQGVLDRLGMATFADANVLQKAGNSIFISQGAQPQSTSGANGNTTFEQGSIEQSNTNVVWEMMQSIAGTRHYESLQKSLQQQNQTLGKTVNEVGKL
jgi:flagellar basal-body rod protein FlgG